jgi:hypothetical protein
MHHLRGACLRFEGADHRLRGGVLMKQRVITRVMLALAALTAAAAVVGAPVKWG